MIREKVVETSIDENIVTPVQQVIQETQKIEPNLIETKNENVAEVISHAKHTTPPECHGERKDADPAAAEEYKAKKHKRSTKTKETTAFKVTEPTKKSTRRHGVKFDDNGDSVWVDDSNDSPDSSDEKAKKKLGTLDADGNMIDNENQASGDRNEESEEESEESDGIPIITIPLVDILNKYARMMGGKRASNSRYEYSYEDENDIKIKEIKDRVLDEASQEDDIDKDVVDI